MDGNPDDASGWKNKFKKAVDINKQLVPLKMTMLLYYGGNYSIKFDEMPVRFFLHLFVNMLLYSCVTVFAIHDASNDPSGSQH